MKILFFSDIHGNQYAYKAFLEEIENAKVDLMIYGGDTVGYYYGAESILTSLRKMDKLVYLRGNHDQMFLDAWNGSRDLEYLIDRYGICYKKLLNDISVDNLEFLREKKESAYYLEVDGLKIAFFHGGPADSLEMRIYPDTELDKYQDKFTVYDYVFCGHTHHKMIRTIDNCTIINPGSIGQQRDGKGTSFVIFDTKTREISWRVFLYDICALEREIDGSDDKQEMKSRLREVLRRDNTL